MQGSRVTIGFVAALIAVLALSAGSTNAADAGRTADAAAKAKKNKKCKKVKKGKRAAAKKRKCKRKKRPAPAAATAPTPPGPPAPAPVRRAHLEWTSASGTSWDLTLFTVLAEEEVACIFCPSAPPAGIRESSTGGTDGLQSVGEEWFDDSQAGHTRKFSYIVCAGPSEGPSDANWSLDLVYADGSTETKIGTFPADSPGVSYEDPGDSVDVLTSEFC
jgi:hypothetical protein